MFESRFAKKFILSLFISIIPMIIFGCGTFWSPLYPSDIAMLEGQKKYPLKVAVIAKNFTFTPDRERGSYYSY